MKKVYRSFWYVDIWICVCVYSLKTNDFVCMILQKLTKANLNEIYWFIVKEKSLWKENGKSSI